ncbi:MULTISPECIES: CerR family C-terminal domain-containing protein [unclassified Paracoccus (in: a-proteobacteria)]|uniref:CerR family C-terminal domain-containing protein n=1 Tax=unclassified Paracoccus (in: a-proteobacteria) TaxID=2688777 RepID=UPI001601C968|nr:MULTISPECIES: CerR family C-terminal domain-containing protein [unclassified Paracoccus (in: a-proteobacteria)]MBB1490155.1 CerR family C-terminal domain-containing protein [Paracoccus sp. MC1854]MBB1496742.1 CerR family C-terminal domain-containing protein [Paracoccus sp. MC1862]QQO43745.1 CerR family C-terminal domain-containing protein [Paracoccus sp. MC1862]
MSQPVHPTITQLVAAGVHLFGRDGFEATSTRAIAAKAGTNISSIAYHFGGKEGLRLACADAVAASIGQVAQAIPAEPGAIGRDQARRSLRRLMRRIVTFLMTPAAADVVGFLLRELAIPDSPVLDRLCARLIEPRHRALCLLWGAATGSDPDSEDTRLAVFSLVGQAAYFRLAAPLVQRRMGWPGYSRREARAIQRRLLANLDAILDAADG